MIWSRSARFEDDVNRLRRRVRNAERDAATAAADRDKWHDEADRLRDQLAAEIAHSGRVHRDLVELQDAVSSGDVVKRLADRLHHFTEASVDCDRAVRAALAEHRAAHQCTPTAAPAGTEPEPEPETPAVLESTGGVW